MAHANIHHYLAEGTKQCSIASEHPGRDISAPDALQLLMPGVQSHVCCCLHVAYPSYLLFSAKSKEETLLEHKALGNSQRSAQCLWTQGMLGGKGLRSTEGVGCWRWHVPAVVACWEWHWDHTVKAQLSVLGAAQWVLLCLAPD